jgi:hypothetical protein
MLFGFLADCCFEGVSAFFFCYLNVDFYPEIFALIAFVVMLISLVVFKNVKVKLSVVSKSVVSMDSG